MNVPIVEHDGIFPDDIVVRQLGFGKSGLVIEIILDNKHVACKIIPASLPNTYNEIKLGYLMSSKYPDYFINIYGYNRVKTIDINSKYLTNSSLEKYNGNSGYYLLFMELGTEDVLTWLHTERDIHEYYDLFLSIRLMLKYLDAEKIKHLDFFFKNMIVTFDNKFKLCDFGAAKIGGNGSDIGLFNKDLIHFKENKERVNTQFKKLIETHLYSKKTTDEFIIYLRNYENIL